MTGFAKRAGDVPCGPNSTVYMHHLVRVINTTFVNNKAAWDAGALSIEQVHGTTVCVNRIILFRNFIFENNSSESMYGTAEAVSVVDDTYGGLTLNYNI